MDTKLKKSSYARKGICTGSSTIFVALATATFIVSIILIIAYAYAYQYSVVKDIQGDIAKLWLIEAPLLLLTLISFIIAMIYCGNKDEEGNIQLNWFDKIFNEVQIIGAAFVGCIFVASGYLFSDYMSKTNAVERWSDLAYNKAIPKDVAHDVDSIGHYFSTSQSDFEPKWIELTFAIILTAVVFTVILLVALSFVKKLKAHCFWNYTIIGRFYYYLKNTSNKSDNIFLKVMLILILACIVSATWIGLFPVLILIVIFVPKWISKYQSIKEGVDEVKSGNLEYKIDVDDHDNGELDKLARSINEISAATNIAVKNELKNQRMKTDLISNVSHDLKTPLTSMISYVDLLKREGLDSENAPEYLEILDEKTKRLQKLTEDLFEAAKASSGSIPVNLERIEMTSIVNQAIGELNDKLDTNNLQLYFNPKAEVNYVLADGQLLWRVIENLLVNVSKYALPGSRVYLDITEKGEDMILLEVKNMSKEPLNISTEELMERFKRGDDSRNTEGSGLGLAIAKDLSHLMNGWFDISIDGDLFKASVALPKVE